jgi:hypothetical protein
VGLRALVVGGFTVGIALLVGAGRAAAQEPATPVTSDQVAAAIAEEGWYADPDSVGDREQLADVAERLARGAEPMGFALLDSEPAGSSTVYAEQVLDALPAQGEVVIRTVVVLSDADVGVVSDAWSDRAIDDALDETIDDLRADPTDGLEALADSLTSQPTGFSDDEDSGSGSGSSSTGWLVLGVLVVGGFAVASRVWSESGGDGFGDGLGDSDGNGYGSSWSRRRRSFARSSSRRRSSGGSSSRRRSSSSGSRRGRGGRRL